MSDEIDSANDKTMFLTELMVKELSKRPPAAMPTGVCLLENCGWPVPEGHRWCDADCRDLWEKEQKRKR